MRDQESTKWRIIGRLALTLTLIEGDRSESAITYLDRLVSHLIGAITVEYKFGISYLTKQYVE